MQGAKTMEQTGTINPVVGNLSVKKYGLNSRKLPEQARIQQHLSFVQSYLHQRTPTGLTRPQKQNRNHLLSLLGSYTQQGLFPCHNDMAIEQRTPRFVDHRGVHCAVGFLLKESGDDAWPQQINQRFEYAKVAQIDSSNLVDWAQVNGLQINECAMIQPQYLPPVNELCPILMLAKDTPLEEKLGLVRAFRDQKLAKSPRGRWAVKYYYKNGPAVVSFLNAQKWSQAPTRKLLAMIIDALEKP